MCSMKSCQFPDFAFYANRISFENLKIKFKKCSFLAKFLSLTEKAQTQLNEMPGRI